MKINLKDNKTRLILFFMITGWIRVLALVIPGTLIYMNVNQEKQTTPANDNPAAIIRPDS